MDLRAQLAALFGNQPRGLVINPLRASLQVQQPDSALVAQIPQETRPAQMAPQMTAPAEYADGPMNDSNIPPQLSRPAPRPQAPQQDTQGMDDLMMALQGGTTAGQNANIDDDTRTRALAFALRNAQQ